MYKNLYSFSCKFIDNSGYHQYFTIKANDKQTAIDKAFVRAKKHAKGDIHTWEVKLNYASY